MPFWFCFWNSSFPALLLCFESEIPCRGGKDKRAKQAGPIIIHPPPVFSVSIDCVLLLCRPTAVSVASEAQVEGDMVVVVVVALVVVVVVSTSATVDVPVVPPREVLGLAKTQTS